MFKIHKKGECIRNVANYSHIKPSDKMDKLTFNLKTFSENIYTTSPKLQELIKTINTLDEADVKKENRQYKHIIYTDIKSSSAGSKIIAAGLMSNGFKNIYDKSLKVDENSLSKNLNKNFALLCSVQIYDKPFPVSLKKKILSIFNKRPDNIYGEQLRFIILDQGFKEGIDLFDVKYVHLFEPLISKADQTQAIGRGTRYCGQKGLEFNSELGWPLHVFKYDIVFDDELKEKYKVSSIHDLFINNSGINLSKLIFANELEKISKYGAVDYELTENIHNFDGDNLASIENIGKISDTDISYLKYKSFGSHDFDLVKKVPRVLGGSARLSKFDGSGIKGKKKKEVNIHLGKAPEKIKSFVNMRKYIREKFSKQIWGQFSFENKCVENKEENKEGNNRIVEYTPTQAFVSKYFTHSSAHKGLLLWHSVGTGKTCSAIAVASNGFEPHGYTILWVTRHTLKSDIWKNMFTNVCSSIIKRKILSGDNIPKEVIKNPLKYLSGSWIMPISYKQFTNMLAEKNDIYRLMKKRNGAEDPLRKTLVIIDEVHKLYSTDLPVAERPNLKLLKSKIKNSYSISGKDSVKLLLMSATPYTSDPMDLIKILNLMRVKDIPETFEEFSKEFLDNDYKFTDAGAKKYLDFISGYISYLNREKDARQFAYPVYYKINVPLSRQMKASIDNLNNELKEQQNQLEKLQNTKGNTKEEKVKNKEDIKIIKQSIKQFKKQIKEKTKEAKNDYSQETSIENCLKK
jgi:superfamily II DNA or RNA helicase